MKLEKLFKLGAAFGAFVLVSFAVFAQDHAAAAASGNSEALKFLALSSAIGMGIAALGCGLGQGLLVSRAMEGISRNPGAAKDMFVPMLIGLAFIEALTILTLIFVFIFKTAFPI